MVAQVAAILIIDRVSIVWSRHNGQDIFGDVNTIFNNYRHRNLRTTLPSDFWEVPHMKMQCPQAHNNVNNYMAQGL